MSESSIGVTPGSGAKVATHKITEGGEEKHIQRQALSDPSGAPLAGRKSAALSVPLVLSTEDLAALLKTQAATGFVVIPSSSAAALTEPSRSIIITAAGNLGVKLADGSDNNADLIPVTPGMVLPLQAVQKTALNTAGFLGLRN